jgi:hypothetical protein
MTTLLNRLLGADSFTTKGTKDCVQNLNNLMTTLFNRLLGADSFTTKGTKDCVQNLNNLMTTLLNRLLGADSFTTKGTKDCVLKLKQSNDYSLKSPTWGGFFYHKRHKGLCPKV